MNAQRARHPNRRNERGSILILSVVGMVIAIISASLAIDLGFLAHEIRVDQKVADLAALDAVRMLPANPTSAAQASALRNGFPYTDPGYGLVVEWSASKAGPWTSDITKLGTAAAIKVSATSPHTNFFPFVPGGQSKTRSAIAGNVVEAEFSVGSTLASIDTQDSILDPVLGRMLAGPPPATAVNLNAVSYDGLATGNVSLAALQQNLLAMGYDVGTTDKLLTTSVGVADLLTASGQALTAQGNTLAAAEVNDIPVATILSTATVKLGQLVYLSQPGSDSALDTELNVFRILTGAAQVSNGTNFVAVPGVGVTLPGGLGTVSFSLGVIEPAQTARGPVGVEAKTSQVRLRLHISLLKTGLLAALAPVDLTLDFTAASAKGTLTTITCGASPSITITPTTSGAAVSGTGTILAPIGGTLTATGSLAATAAGSPRLFNYTTDFAPSVGTDADGQHVGAATLILTPANVTVTGSGGVLGLGATVGTVVDTLLTSTVLPAVDSLAASVLQPVLQRLGLDVAGADITAIDIYPTPPACGGAALIG